LSDSHVSLPSHSWESSQWQSQTSFFDSTSFTGGDIFSPWHIC
jgi:hypothetical protein